MCKTHNQVSGKASVELYAEARILNNVCEARMDYLRKQAMSFHTWLGKQVWCEDADLFCQRIVTGVEHMLDPDSEKVAEYLFHKEEVSAGDVIAQEYDGYAHQLELIADKGMRKAYSKEEKVKDLEARIEKYKEELILHGKISDGIDGLPKATIQGQYKAIFKRLDILKSEGKLSYSGWVIFTNQMLELIGRKPMVAKYEIKCVADLLREAEAKLADLNKEIMEQPEFFRDEHEEADEFIKLNS